VGILNSMVFKVDEHVWAQIYGKPELCVIIKVQGNACKVVMLDNKEKEMYVLVHQNKFYMNIE
jgi:hypothetical protein